MDPSQFLGQLAQFGTVTGIQDMQNRIRHAVGCDALVAGARRREHGRPRRARCRATKSRCTAERLGARRARRARPARPSLQVNIHDESGALVRRDDAADRQRPAANSPGTASPTTARARPPATTRSRRSPASTARSGSLEMLFVEPRQQRDDRRRRQGLTLNTNDLGARRARRRAPRHVTNSIGDFNDLSSCLERSECGPGRSHRHRQQHRQHRDRRASRARARSSPSCSRCPRRA